MEKKYEKILKLSNKIIKTYWNDEKIKHYVNNYISWIGSIIVANELYKELWEDKKIINDINLAKTIYITLKKINWILKENNEVYEIINNFYQNQKYCPKELFKEIIEKNNSK